MPDVLSLFKCSDKLGKELIKSEHQYTKKRVECPRSTQSWAAAFLYVSGCDNSLVSGFVCIQPRLNKSDEVALPCWPTPWRGPVESPGSAFPHRALPNLENTVFPKTHKNFVALNNAWKQNNHQPNSCLLKEQETQFVDGRRPDPVGCTPSLHVPPQTIQAFVVC